LFSVIYVLITAWTVLVSEELLKLARIKKDPIGSF